jgi:arsenite methyltransferase
MTAARPPGRGTTTAPPGRVAAHDDPWAEWLLHRRDGGDPEILGRNLPPLQLLRDLLLDNAEIRAGHVVLDVGSGTGLIAFGALDRVGATGRVVFSDVSSALLDRCRARAAEEGQLDRCRFIQAEAGDLGPVHDRSVDVVTTRSVLVYVPDRPAAFAEFFRVLRPGGRISLFEPVDGMAGPEPEGSLLGIDVTPVEAIARKVRDALWAGGLDRLHQLDVSELIGGAERAGFVDIRLDLHADVQRRQPWPAGGWDLVKRLAMTPLTPTLEEVLDEVLAADERRAFEAFMRQAVERTQPASRTAVTFLHARRPG